MKTAIVYASYLLYTSYTDLLFEVEFYFVSEHLPDDSDKLAGTVQMCIRDR